MNSHRMAVFSVALATVVACATQTQRQRQSACEPVFVTPAGIPSGHLAGSEGEAASINEVTVARMQLVQLAAAAFCVDSGRYPRADAALAAARRTGEHLSRCTFDPSYLVDGWGKQVLAEWSDDRPPRLRSSGRDRIFETGDDILSPDSAPGSVRKDAMAVCGGTP